MMNGIKNGMEVAAKAVPTVSVSISGATVFGIGFFGAMGVFTAYEVYQLCNVVAKAIVKPVKTKGGKDPVFNE